MKLRMLTSVAALAVMAAAAAAQEVVPGADAAAGDAPADPCASDFAEPRELSLHIAAVFIQVAISLTGTVIPIALQRWNVAGRLTDFVFEGIRNFGTGIILATGFIHMLLPAVGFLTSPCLAPVWNQDYMAFAGVFAIAGILLTQLLQFLAASYLTSAKLRAEAAKPTSSLASTVTDTSASSQNGTGAAKPSAHVHGPGDLRDPESAAVALGVDAPHAHPYHHEDDGHGHLRDALVAGGPVAEDLRKKQATVYLLEAGIASHSFFIGLILGTTRGAELRALMVALAFHQFFEGMALSATLLDAKFKSRAPAFIMVILYTVITPLGVAVGVALNEAYNPNSQVALLTQGILDAFSAGILIYDSLVNLLHVNVTANVKFHTYPAWKKAAFYGFFYAGLTVMSIIGRYA